MREDRGETGSKRSAFLRALNPSEGSETSHSESHQRGHRRANPTNRAQRQFRQALHLPGQFKEFGISVEVCRQTRSA